MNNVKMVAPSGLHRALEWAAVADATKRRELLGLVLASDILAVIRRIPEVLSPLTADDKEQVFNWAAGFTDGDTDVSSRDFAFHTLVNCGIDSSQILDLLVSQGTYSQTALDHIRLALGGDRSRFNKYMNDVANALLQDQRVPSRDRARHIFMTLARTPEDWQTLAKHFTDHFSDLRQRVIEAFLEQCNDQNAFEFFCQRVMDECLLLIDNSWSGYQVAPQMHWFISCAEKLGWRGNLLGLAQSFANFGRTLPESVRNRIPQAPAQAMAS